MQILQLLSCNLFFHNFFYYNASTFAARIKSLTLSPSILCVQIVKITLPPAK